MKRWRIVITDIEWDDGKGEYDTAHLKAKYSKIVEAETKRDAIEAALEAVSDEACMLMHASTVTAIPWNN